MDYIATGLLQLNKYFLSTYSLAQLMICFVQLKKALLGPKRLVEVENSVPHGLYTQEFIAFFYTRCGNEPLFFHVYYCRDIIR